MEQTRVLVRRSVSVGGGVLPCSLVILLAGCSLFGSAEGDPENGVDHRVYEGEAPTYEMPGSVSRVAWEWEVPDQEISLNGRSRFRWVASQGPGTVGWWECDPCLCQWDKEVRACPTRSASE